MFSELIKTQTATVRGKEFVFHEIGALDWIEYIVNDRAAELTDKKDIYRENQHFGIRCIACSIAPGKPDEIKQYIADLEPLSRELIDDLFTVVDELNQISAGFKSLAGKGIQADTLPAV